MLLCSFLNPVQHIFEIRVAKEESLVTHCASRLSSILFQNISGDHLTDLGNIHIAGKFKPDLSQSGEP